MSTPEVEGVSHVALTVTDLDASVAWYERLFETSVLWHEENDGHRLVVLFAPPLLIGLHQFSATPTGDSFSETRVGLDHVSWQVPDLAGLEAWAKQLEELDITHSPITEAPYGTTLVFRDPDNIQLEFFALPG